jgi:hypothetical protein
MSSKMTVYEQKLQDLIRQISDKDVRAMMQICVTNKKLPQDCLVDGALEKLITYILVLEAMV